MESPSQYTIIVQIVNFIILLFVLKKVLYEPLLEASQKREETIRSKLDEADSVNAEALTFKEKYEKKLSTSKQEANALLAQAAAEGERIKSELIQEGRSEARHIHARAMEELERERENAYAALKKEVANLSADIASRILKESFDPASHAKFTAEFLRKAEKHAL
jgi:F-type H+-transporting ATPase subunit b